MRTFLEPSRDKLGFFPRSALNCSSGQGYQSICKPPKRLRRRTPCPASQPARPRAERHFMIYSGFSASFEVV